MDDSIGRMKNAEELQHDRFKGKLSEEYHLVKLAYPNMEEFQRCVGSVVSSYRPDHEGAVKVLEIGTGTGVTTDLLLRHREDIDLHSVDSELAMIELADENLEGWKGERRFTLIHADARSYLESIAADTFDLVVSVWTLHNLYNTDRNHLLREIYRTLRPGGVFVNGDKFAQDDEAHQAALELQMKRFFDAYLPIGKYQFLREFVLHNLADEAPSRIMRESGARMTMMKIGFERIETIYRENMEAVLVASKS